MATKSQNRIDLRVFALAFAIGDEPPKEFRIFAAGENATRKGTFIFDEQAARDVMSAYEAHGLDIMLDLEHLSLEDPTSSIGFDPDARGWGKLELRNGELWAATVSWTPDGDTRLRERRQRYISPAFEADPKTRRITRLLNIAITALPATDHLAPLIAATERLAQGDPTMPPEQLAAIAEALGLGADANVEDVIATIAAMVKKIQTAANGDGDPEDKAEPPEAVPADAAPPMAAAMRIHAAACVLARLSGKKEIGEIVHEVEAWRESHLALEAKSAKLATERTALETGERRRLVGELVKLGAETPATAWDNDDGKTPTKRLADEPIADLRSRVGKLTAAKGGTVRTVVTRPPPGGAIELSERELAICAEKKIDPAVYAKTRAGIKARNASNDGV